MFVSKNASQFICNTYIDGLKMGSPFMIVITLLGYGIKINEHRKCQMLKQYPNTELEALMSGAIQIHKP